jgi:hypothetical protein
MSARGGFWRRSWSEFSSGHTFSTPEVHDSRPELPQTDDLLRVAVGSSARDEFPLSHPRRGPAELASQHATDLVEDCRGDTDLDQTGAPEGEHLVGRAGEVQRGDVDVGVGDDPRHTTGRGGTPGWRLRRPSLSRPPSGRGRRHSAGAHASVAPHCSGAAPPAGPRSWCALLLGQALRFSDEVRGKRERADSCGGHRAILDWVRVLLKACHGSEDVSRSARHQCARKDTARAMTELLSNSAQRSE